MEADVKAFELRELWRRYKEGGDTGARERLVVAYSPLVKFVAGRTGARLPSHVDQADLISYGMIGLVEAMERFEPDRQIRFETFAMQRIRGAIIDELRSLDWVPRSVRSRAREIEVANSRLEHELGRAPTDAELAERLGLTEEELQEALLQISNSSILALEELWMTPDASGDKVSLLDTIEDESAPDPQAALDTSEVKDRLGAGDPGSTGARDARRRPLLLRKPHPAGDRRGPGRHRVTRLAAPFEGRAAPALAPQGDQLNRA